ncbi:hypothetical protein Tco_0271429 [Tanacetum coccineum]
MWDSPTFFLFFEEIRGKSGYIAKASMEVLHDSGHWGTNVDKTENFLPKKDPRSRLVGVFPPNIARPLHGAKLLSGPASVDFNLCSELVMKRVTKTIVFMDTIAKINNPYCELLLLRACAERILTASGHAYGATFNDALCVFNRKRETGLLSNTSEIATPKLMKKLGGSDFWVGTDYERDICGDHVVSCAGIIGIKHQHNVVRDTLVNICFRSGISAGKDVDIGLGGGCDKPLRLVDMLLYSWDEELDVCVDLTGSSHLTQTGMVDFVLGCMVIDAAHRKRVKYEAKCANIGYAFLPFSFSSLGELEKDAVTLLK